MVMPGLLLLSNELVAVNVAPPVNVRNRRAAQDIVGLPLATEIVEAAEVLLEKKLN